MPALAQALAGSLSEPALRQLMQALGNCQQPLTHRGEINLQPPYSTGPGGLVRPGTWSPNAFGDLLPTAGQNVTVDIAGSKNLVTNNNYGGHQFHFPLNQYFAYNNYFGGDTFNVAGDSVFNNSYHNTLESYTADIDFLTVKNIFINNPASPGMPAGPAGEPGAPGGGGGEGGAVPGFPGGGGGGFGPIIPPAGIGVSTFLKDVTVRGTVVTNEVTAAALKDKTVDITPNKSFKTVASTGSITIPTVEGVSLTAFTSAGTVSLTTITGGTISGGTASGSVTYSRPTSATCGAITGSVTMATGGTFSVAPTGIAATGGLGTLSGTVTIAIPTGGYFDAGCNLILTTTDKTYNVVFSGAPSATITSQGTVAGNVTLTGSTTRSVTISTPAITLNQAATTAAVTLPVSGVSFTAATGSTTASVSMTTATATFGLSNGSTTQSIGVTGSVEVNDPSVGTVRDSTVSLTSGQFTKTLKLTVGKKSDFIVYLRPRF